VRTLISIVNQREHSELFKENGVRISENPDKIVNSQPISLVKKSRYQADCIHRRWHSIFEIRVDKGAQGVSKTVHEISNVKGMLYIAIQRNGKLIIPSGNVTFQSDDVITIFTKKEAEIKSTEYMNNLFH
jgi:trk system potassium uptake protein TrkA